MINYNIQFERLTPFECCAYDRLLLAASERQLLNLDSSSLGTLKTANPDLPDPLLKQTPLDSENDSKDDEWHWANEIKAMAAY